MPDDFGYPSVITNRPQTHPSCHSDPVKAQQGRGVALVGVKGAAGMSIFIHSPISSSTVSLLSPSGFNYYVRRCRLFSQSDACFH